MTTTWANLLADIRTDLQDTGESPRWSNDYLYLLTKDAVRDYSQYFPLRMDKVTLSESGTGWALPSDFVEDIYVESPEDTFLRRREEFPGNRYNSPSVPNQYYISGGKLYLNASPSEDVILTYYALHGVPSSVSSTTFVFTIPDGDIELLRIYVRAQVHAQMRSKTARLDRFDPGSGRRDDNPISPEVGDLMKEYYTKIQARIRGGAIKLYAVGRSSA